MTICRQQLCLKFINWTSNIPSAFLMLRTGAVSFRSMTFWVSLICDDQVIVQRLRLSGDFDFKSVASRTPGFVGADLQALTKEAAAVAIARIFNTLPLPEDAGLVGSVSPVNNFDNPPSQTCLIASSA